MTLSVLQLAMEMWELRLPITPENPKPQDFGVTLCCAPKSQLAFELSQFARARC